MPGWPRLVKGREEPARCSARKSPRSRPNGALPPGTGRTPHGHSAARLLARYDRLRSGTQRGPVVVPLHGNACGNCYTAVPMSRRSHIRAGLLLDGCEGCGVILYSATEVVEA